jgi:glutamate carboxypeptidase
MGTLYGGADRAACRAQPVGPGSEPGPDASLGVHMSTTLEFCLSQRGWLVDTIEALVRLESPTTDKAALDACGAEIARRLEAIGARVERLPRSEAGDHLRAEFGSGSAQVLLLCHFDTVWPLGQLERMPLHRGNGRLHGPGAFDMKAGIAIGMLAVRALTETDAMLPDRIVMLLTSDEETGSRTSRAAIEEEARRSRAVLVLEPSLPGGAVKTERKGCGECELVVRGVTAHAGIEPGKGASAIHELARQVRALEQLQDPERGISVNVGTISGGIRTNVIAGEARAGVDVRVTTLDDGRRIETAIRGLRPFGKGTTLEVSGAVDRPPLERAAGVVRLYGMARDVASSLGLGDLAEGSTGGGSDGNFTAAIGIPTLDGLGAIGDGAHALHEYIELAPLAGRAALVAGLIARIAAP